MCFTPISSGCARITHSCDSLQMQEWSVTAPVGSALWNTPAIFCKDARRNLHSRQQVTSLEAQASAHIFESSWSGRAYQTSCRSFPWKTSCIACFRGGEMLVQEMCCETAHGQCGCLLR